MMKTYGSDQFTYSKKSDTFTAEASTLGFFDGGSFYIRSKKTGNVRLFLITEQEYTQDEEHEVIAWHGFCPAGGFHVTVLND